MSTIAERVKAGAELLDREEPGWEQRIDLDELRLSDACRCVLGQLFADRAKDAEDDPYSVGVDVLGIGWATADFGFNDAAGQYGLLTCVWKALIRERRQALPAAAASERGAEGQ